MWEPVKCQPKALGTKKKKKKKKKKEDLFLVRGTSIFTWLLEGTWNFLQSHKEERKKKKIEKNMEILQSLPV